MEDNQTKKEEFESPKEAAEEGVTSTEDTIETLREALNKKEAECKELQDKYLRTLAEMENFRKRMMREQAESLRYANEKIISDLLSVVDNIDRAILHSKEKKDFDALIDGLELTRKEFDGVLEKYGVKCIEAVGLPFDPSKHHAVATVESDTHEDNVIVEEFRKGYILNDRILRPPLVSVSKKREETEKEQE